jgi:glutathione S-transferase
MPPSIHLYRFALSGHSHRVQLMLSLLQLPCTLHDVNLAAGEHKSQAFLARNAFAQVPVIADGDFTLADSNAILVYLALTYDPRAQASIQRWLSMAAGPLAFGPAAARVATLFGRPANPQSQGTAQTLFDLMERHLTDRNWLATDEETIADIAMYSYTAHAPEGGIALSPWPNIRAWLQRVEALPGFVPMQRSPIPGATQ